MCTAAEDQCDLVKELYDRVEQRFESVHLRLDYVKDCLRQPHARVGISRDPQGEANAMTLFEWLQQDGTLVCHLKVCMSSAKGAGGAMVKWIEEEAKRGWQNDLDR